MIHLSEIKNQEEIVDTADQYSCRRLQLKPLGWPVFAPHCLLAEELVLYPAFQLSQAAVTLLFGITNCQHLQQILLDPQMM